MNLSASLWGSTTEAQNPQDIFKQIATDTLAAFGLGAAFKGVGVGVSKFGKC